MEKSFLVWPREKKLVILDQLRKHGIDKGGKWRRSMLIYSTRVASLWYGVCSIGWYLMDDSTDGPLTK